MKPLIVLLLLISSAFISSALTPGEISAIEAIYQNFPKLGIIDPPWTSNASNACGTPGFEGITCSLGPEPHVLGLYDTICVQPICLLFYRLYFAFQALLS